MNFWQDKPVLVTGAGGFLGGWLVRALLEREARVIALLRRDKPESQFALAGFAERATVELGDVSEAALMESILDRHQVEAIFHTTLAGGDVGANLAAPVPCFQSTIASTWVLLDKVRRDYPDCVVVVSSSDKAYGAASAPYREDQPLVPGHPQEVAKASQDWMTQSYGRVYGLNTAVTRCANFFGPFDFNFSRLVPYVLQCVVKNRQPQLRSNGRFVRDFMYVEEAARVHLGLAEQLATREELRGEVFNYSHGVRLTVIEIVQRLLNLAGADLKPVIQDRVTDEIPSMWVNSSKARTLLGWTPLANFEDSLALTAEWYLRYFRSGTIS